MSQESKTPRTDAAASKEIGMSSITPGWYVHADFARDLERELAAVTEERDALIASARIKEANSGWRPIETAPKERGTILLGRNTDGLRIVAIWDRGNKIWFDSELIAPVRAPTHWMPLVELPTTTELGQ